MAQLQVVTVTPDPVLGREHTDRAIALARHSLGEARRPCTTSPRSPWPTTDCRTR
ncbi:hypothetical protein LV779_01340 [Streptomyces thinghirensis]|nr:hypothetical protein [Streptomyces thinghirensis]